MSPQISDFGSRETSPSHRWFRPASNPRLSPSLSLLLRLLSHVPALESGPPITLLSLPPSAASPSRAMELPPRIPLSPVGTLYTHRTPSHSSSRILAASDPPYLNLLAFARGSLPPHPPHPHACSLDPSSPPWTRLSPSRDFWKKAPWRPVSLCSAQSRSGSVLGRASQSSPHADSVAHILI